MPARGGIRGAISARGLVNTFARVGGRGVRRRRRGRLKCGKPGAVREIASVDRDEEIGILQVVRLGRLDDGRGVRRLKPKGVTAEGRGDDCEGRAAAGRAPGASGTHLLSRSAWQMTRKGGGEGGAGAQ